MSISALDGTVFFKILFSTPIDLKMTFMAVRDSLVFFYYNVNQFSEGQ